jgi:hypothetical protein
MALSNLWPRRTVVGFVTFGFTGTGRTAAGNVVDTLRGAEPSTVVPGLPRMDWRRPSAKHARDGQIIVWPRPEALWNDVHDRDPAFEAVVARQAQRFNSRERSRTERSELTPPEYYRQRMLDVGR